MRNIPPLNEYVRNVFIRPRGGAFQKEGKNRSQNRGLISSSLVDKFNHSVEIIFPGEKSSSQISCWCFSSTRDSPFVFFLLSDQFTVERGYNFVFHDDYVDPHILRAFAFEIRRRDNVPT